MAATQTLQTIIALDVGTVRTGVAIVNNIARIASPLMVIGEQGELAQKVAALVSEHDTKALVVGLPRNMQGDETSQTKYVERVATEIKQQTDIPLYFIDEAVTSAQAERELQARRRPYTKEDIDMLAATYILEDFMREHPEVL